MQIISMMRMRAVPFLVLGMALGVASATGEIIRSGKSDGSLITKGKAEEVTVFRPATMGTNRMKRFEKRSTLPEYKVTRKSRSVSSVKIKATEEKSKVVPRRYPVVKLSASGAK